MVHDRRVRQSSTRGSTPFEVVKWVYASSSSSRFMVRRWIPVGGRGTRTSSLSRWISLLGFFWRALHNRDGTLLLGVHRQGPGWWIHVEVRAVSSTASMSVCWHEVARASRGRLPQKGESISNTDVGSSCPGPACSSLPELFQFLVRSGATRFRSVIARAPPHGGKSPRSKRSPSKG